MDFIDALDWGTYYFFQQHRRTHTEVQRLLTDLTALGSGYVFALIGLFAVGLLLMACRYRTALLVAVTFLAGWLCVESFKILVDRSRPPDARDSLQRPMRSPSFPSGHSLESAVAYPTLAMLFGPLLPWRRARYFVYA